MIWLLHRILRLHQVKAITLRNDNGSQFKAHAFRDYLKDNQVVQEFIHVATPEENCFIEAYHSIIQRELLEPRQFDSVEQAQQIFERWQQFYNNRRLHGSLGNNTRNKYGNSMSKATRYNKEPLLQDCTDALSTNGERKSLKIEESRFVDKILHDPMSAIFEDQRAENAQTVP